MARYVDGFVMPIPKKNLDAYKAMAKKAMKIWMDNGALDYSECVGEDLKPKSMPGITTFLDLTQSAKNETVIFSWITYRSRAHRDKVNAKVMKDPRMQKIMESGMPMPFDMSKMAYGGFDVLVGA
jgi:uncharacterized protein YbaA (DUF1428 family)